MYISVSQFTRLILISLSTAKLVHPADTDNCEVTPGITAQEYHLRRQRFAASLPDGAVAVLPAAPLKYKSGAVFYPYRQESNFWYLTGWQEPESIVVIQRRDADYHFILFCRPKSSVQEQWMGPWNGLDAAQDFFNADEVQPISHASISLRQILKNATYLYTDVDLARYNEDKVTVPLRDAKLPVRSVSPLVNEMRVVKSTAEIEVMQHAGTVSGQAFNKIMNMGLASEADISHTLNYYFTKDMCNGHAYIPVVAAGNRGLFIHWVQNTGIADPGDLVTVDAGAEYGYYVADITRTWPVNGKFTPAQKDLYQAVLSAQRKLVSMCHESSMHSLESLHKMAETELSENLRDIGFDLSPPAFGNRGGIETLFPHHIGHYLGIDVHDVPGYPKNKLLKEGNVITIEPGIYVPDDERWPKHFRGMGIRIEDDVVVEKETVRVLSSTAVKEIDDIEHLYWTMKDNNP